MLYLQAHLGGDRQTVSVDARPAGAKHLTALQQLPDDNDRHTLIARFGGDVLIGTSSRNVRARMRQVGLRGVLCGSA
jgi:hypothetical protein